MRYFLIIHPDVYEDLSEAIDYYKQKQEGLEEKLVNDWRGALELVEKHPFSFQKAYKGFRRLSLVTFPYMVIYEVENSEVHIYRLIYSGKEPIKRYKKR